MIPRIIKYGMVVGAIVGAAYLGNDYNVRKDKSYWAQFTRGVALKFNQEQAYITTKDGKTVNVDLNAIPTVELLREASKRDPREIVVGKKVVKEELETKLAKEDAEKVAQKIKH